MNRIRIVIVSVLVVSLVGCGPPTPTMGWGQAVTEGNVAEVESNLFWGHGADSMWYGYRKGSRVKVDNPIDKSGREPLHIAAELGHLELAEFLVSRGADVNSTTGYRGCGATPLQVAEAVGDEAMAALLRRLGATDLPASDSYYLDRLRQQRQEAGE
jgi:hypothetical protein